MTSGSAHPARRRSRWKQSKGYQATRRRQAARERGWGPPQEPARRLAHQIAAVGHTVITEKVSQKRGIAVMARAWDFAPQGC